ncbi:MAG: hypothetical protein KDJ37_15900 [Hyphomicrobiaceae bacterium]|nr:hypothetical protein [Hyphomicrobiaceae bacterium]
MMGDYQHWTARGLKRELKPLVNHPTARELAMRAQFVERARLYWWHHHGPSPLPHVGWPPGRAPRESVAEYWHLVIRKHLDHAPHLVTETTNLEDSIALALVLSSANPMLEF